jgi:hypothetical protein
MPLYTFLTNDDVEPLSFTNIMTFKEYDKVMSGEPDEEGWLTGDGPIHPETNKPVKSWRRVMDGVNLRFAQPWESSKWESFGYRAGYNMEKAKEQRRQAEKASHMGENPIQDYERQLMDDPNFDLGESDINNYDGRVI